MLFPGCSVLNPGSCQPPQVGQHGLEQGSALPWTVSVELSGDLCVCGWWEPLWVGVGKAVPFHSFPERAPSDPQPWAIFAVEGVLWHFLPWLTCVCPSRVAQLSPGCSQGGHRAPFPRPPKASGGVCGCVDVPKDGNFCLQLSLRESQRLKACPFLWPVSDYCLVSSFLWVQLLLWELTIQKKNTVV